MQVYKDLYLEVTALLKLQLQKEILLQLGFTGFAPKSSLLICIPLVRA